jgi:hypothetical protein
MRLSWDKNCQTMWILRIFDKWSRVMEVRVLTWGELDAATCPAKFRDPPSCRVEDLTEIQALATAINEDRSLIEPREVICVAIRLCEITKWQFQPCMGKKNVRMSRSPSPLVPTADLSANFYGGFKRGLPG